MHVKKASNVFVGKREQINPLSKPLVDNCGSSDEVALQFTSVLANDKRLWVQYSPTIPEGPWNGL